MDQVSTTLADESFRRAFRPRSVAILGASNDPARISGRALHYMLKAGYDGAIYPVNNRRDTVQGIPAFTMLEAVPSTPDVALLALSAAQTLDAVRACVAKGVGAAVIYAAGFAETGDEGAAMQDEVVAAARAGGLRLFGPNCLGHLPVVVLHLAAGFRRRVRRGLSDHRPVCAADRRRRGSPMPSAGRGCSS